MQLTPQNTDIRNDAVLRAKAADLEAMFVSEMLSHTGMDQKGAAFGGGHGEEQFASFLRQQHAQAIVAAGGLGLAEQLFQALAARTNDAT